MADSDLLKRVECHLPLLSDLSSTLGSTSFSTFLQHQISSILTDLMTKSSSNFAYELKELRLAVKDDLNGMKENVRELRMEIQEVEGKVAGNEGSIQEIGNEMFGVKSDLEQKPTHRDLERIGEKMMTLASQSQVTSLETGLSHCADKDEVRNLEERLQDVKHMLEDYTTEQQTKAAFERVRDECKTMIATLATKSENEQIIDSISALSSELKENIEEIRKNFQAEISDLRRNFGEMKGVIDSLPWKKESSVLFEELGKKATRLEIRQFKEDASNLLQAAGAKLKEVSQTLAEYDGVLRHYDEVLLLKASRDDVKSLQRQFDEAVDTSGLKVQLGGVVEGLEALKDDIQAMDSELESAKVSLDKLSKDQASIPRHDNLVDPSLFFNSLAEVRDLLSSKADRVDVYGLKEGKCEKREIELVSGDLHMVKRQVESIAGTLYALVKDYVEEEPSPLLAEKQKSHLLGHSLSLLNWISGSEVEESPTRKPRPRGLGTRRNPSLGSTLPHVSAFNTPKTRPRTRKDSRSGPHSPSKSLIDSARW